MEHFTKFSLAHFCLHPEEAEHFTKFSLAHFCLYPDVEDITNFSFAHFYLHLEDMGPTAYKTSNSIMKSEIRSGNN